MPVAYFDCFSGIAGDMVIGALIDAGMPVRYLEKGLKKLKMGGYKIKAARIKRDGIGGIDFKVEILRHSTLHGYLDIERLVRSSGLSNGVKDNARQVFRVLAAAEAKVHRRRVSDVHFHEIGGIDSIVDIVGTAIGIDYLGLDKIYSSPLPVTRGFVACAHGRLPVPAPATLEIIKGMPLCRSRIRGEIVTPTGAAILKALSSGFGASPLRVVREVGYGFGDKEFRGSLNAVRLLIGEGCPLVVIEANIDDMNPEFYPAVIEKLLKNGALDAGVIPMVMKKGRPGAIIHLLCEERDRRKMIDLMMRETTTFGVRFFPVEREIAERGYKKVRVKGGVVRVKIARYKGETVTISPEYSDCRKLAKKLNVPIKEIYYRSIRGAY